MYFLTIVDIESFWSRSCIKILIYRCVISCWTPRVSHTISGNFPELSWRFPRNFAENFRNFHTPPWYPHHTPISHIPLTTPDSTPFHTPAPIPFSPVYIFHPRVHLFPPDIYIHMTLAKLLIDNYRYDYSIRYTYMLSKMTMSNGGG